MGRERTINGHYDSSSIRSLIKDAREVFLPSNKLLLKLTNLLLKTSVSRPQHFIFF